MRACSTSDAPKLNTIDIQYAGTRFSDGVPADRGSGVRAFAEQPELIADRYEILARFGAGGMGIVYRAHDRALDEYVALKVLHPKLSQDPRALARFRHEVRLARRVTHRNVARTFDFGEHNGLAYITMEPIEGGSLSQRLARHSVFAAEQAVAVALEVAAGLGAAHAAGVVHLDLKPDNILFGEGDRVVVTDFGIAVAADAVRDPSNGRSIVGTPAYMAPEQLTRPEALDHRVDVYALGLVLYEMLTGQLPWEGKNDFELARARLGQAPRDPRELMTTIPAHVAELVLGCLAVSVDERVPSVDVFRARIERSERSERSERLGEGRQVEVRTLPPLMSRPSMTSKLYSDARTAYHGFWRASDSVVLFERALAKAPLDPRLLGGASLALSRATGMDVDTTSARASARERAELALQLDPSCAEGHVALAVVRIQDGDVAGGARRLRHALDVDPTQVDALEHAATLLLESGAFNEALARAELAGQMEPRIRASLQPSVLRARALMGEWREVETAFRTRPESGGARMSYWLTRIRLAIWRNDPEEKRAVAAELAADEFPHKSFPMLYCRFLDGAAPDVVACQWIAERAQSTTCSPRQRTFFHQLAAEVYAQHGDVKRALDCLDAALELALFDVGWIERCPALEGVRSHPRFVAIRQEVSRRAKLVADTLLAG